MALKADPVEIEKKTAEDNLNYANNKLVALSKSRITQLMQLKEEAEANQDFDKIQEIDAELFQMKS